MLANGLYSLPMLFDTFARAYMPCKGIHRPVERGSCRCIAVCYLAEEVGCRIPSAKSHAIVLQHDMQGWHV